MTAPARSLRAEPLLRCGNTLGEGPLWVPWARRLMWTDILERCLYSLDPRTGRQIRHELSSYVACMGVCDTGELIAAGGLGWLLLGFEQGVARAEPIAGVPFDAASVRFNDGKIGPDGAFWAGTMDLNARQPIGALYRLAAGTPGGGRQERGPAAGVAGGLETRQVQAGLTISNGIGFSPEAAAMYLTESGDGVIFRYDFEAGSGTMRNRRIFVHDAERPGVPDGLAMDAEGNLWSARWGAGEVICYDPEGVERARIELPARQPSSCCFGGDNLDILYITSARYGLEEPGELDGALFGCDCGVRGGQVYRFATGGLRRTGGQA